MPYLMGCLKPFFFLRCGGESRLLGRFSSFSLFLLSVYTVMVLLFRSRCMCASSQYRLYSVGRHCSLRTLPHCCFESHLCRAISQGLYVAGSLYCSTGSIEGGPLVLCRSILASSLFLPSIFVLALSGSFCLSSYLFAHPYLPCSTFSVAVYAGFFSRNGTTNF